LVFLVHIHIDLSIVLYITTLLSSACFERVSKSRSQNLYRLLI
jgi:hypothetical protein